MLELPLQEKMLQGSSGIVGGGESRAEEKRLNLKSQKTCSAGYNMDNEDFFFFQSWLMSILV